MYPIACIWQIHGIVLQGVFDLLRLRSQTCFLRKYYVVKAAYG